MTEKVCFEILGAIDKDIIQIKKEIKRLIGAVAQTKISTTDTSLVEIPELCELSEQIKKLKGLESARSIATKICHT